jgi:hypothetical protein
MPDNMDWYDSIQNSSDAELWIWFRSDFKNITNFWAGESVWDASIPFSSEFMINIWDPLLKRIDDNTTAKTYDENGDEIDNGFDKWLGEVVYSEPGKTIFKVKNIDFNNDDLEDIIVSFTDGTVKIMKNYGWNNPFETLGDLMILADGIKDIIIGDVDGNNYEDIIIWSKSDTLRVYKNNEWVFDVDGYPICLNTNVKDGIVSDNPEDIWWVFQIFFEDMDQDWNLDIVTNDKFGYIKIFYWWTNNSWNQDNYVSSDKNQCDDDWYQRQNTNDNTNMVYRFGIRVNENIKVLDQSLVHRKGINPNNNVNVSTEELWIDTDMFDENNMSEDNIDDIMTQATNFDTDNAVQQYMAIERYKNANFDVIPLYENFENESEVEYVEMWCLTWTDPIDIYKQYEDINWDVLENWDVVEVTVTLDVDDDFVWTFVDNIRWPWQIDLLENGMIEHFWFESWSIDEYKIEDEIEFHRDMVNSRYMIDNLKLSNGDEVKIKYRIIYDGDIQTNKIEIKDIDWNEYHEFGTPDGDTLDEYPKDKYPDIKVKPEWWCNKSIFMLFNEDKDKDYDYKYVDLTELLINYSNDSTSSYENAMWDINNTLLDNVWSEETPDFSGIPWMDSMIESWSSLDIFGTAFSKDSIISNGWVDLSEIVNAPMELVDGLLWDVMDKVDDFASSLCEWIDLSEYWVGWDGNCGLPVPFNQWFLWPGNYHLFGCFDLPPLTETIGKGLPVLTIPGNRWPTPAWYIPAPWIFGLPFKGPTDGFLGVVWWTFDSQFRLYVIPTLTAEIGIAMCFGPYAAWANILDPASSIWGNCIVTAIPLPCKDGWSGWLDISNQIPEAFLDLEACETQNIPCYVKEWESTSSLEIVSSSSNSLNMTSTIPDGSFAGWFINIETQPKTNHGYNTPESWIEIDGIKLVWWADSPNKILWSKAQWLIEKVWKEWMDKQINYILSNLTNFKVDVSWPDFGEIFGWMGNLWSVMENEKKQDCLDQGWEWKDDECDIPEKQKCINRGKEWNDQNNTCVKKSNKNQNETALSNLDNWWQNNLLSRGQVQKRSDSSFANPFEKMEAMFEEVPLINLRTENINVKVPMISSEDITAYVSMSQNWINVQQRILEERKDFFAWVIWRCGWNANVENFEDIKNEIKDIKKQLSEEYKNTLDDWISDMKEQLENATDPKEIEELEDKIKDAEERSVTKKINALNKITKDYNLSDLWEYDIFEACDSDAFFIRVREWSNDQIIYDDIYIKYQNDEFSMHSDWFDLYKEQVWKKIKISYARNWNAISSNKPCIKQVINTKQNQCIDLFLWWNIDVALNNFVDIQTNADSIILSVKENIETLQLYKKFPLDLYEWIHVWDRYLSEISSVINNLLWTLSLWASTNATRYSQYVDSIILLTTTIQTYQAIIDLSTDWSKRCSSCTNDNYDQFACKLWLLCPPASLPIIEIPPMKIPSIYIDLSDFNMATDIKLPKFNFVPTSVPLPSLPNIPSPPKINWDLDLEQSLAMWINLVWDLAVELDVLDVAIDLPSIPTIPAPPDLPEIPSFIPSVKLELPLLPPAPKIPKLPNEITASIELAETIWRILCIVKGNIWLVGEDSIKAKVEQMTQRTYEVPYWDTIDQTFSSRNKSSNSKLPDWLTNTFGFLKSNEFEEVELEWFDISLESHVNLQYDFDGFYSFIDQVVWEINKYSSMPEDFIQNNVDRLDEYSRELESKMSACTNNPVSLECMWDAYTQEIKDKKEYYDKLDSEINTTSQLIEKWFKWIKEAKQKIVNKEDEKNELLLENESIEEKLSAIDSTDVANNSLIKQYSEQIDTNNDSIEEIDIEIDNLYDTYGGSINTYDQYLETYNTIKDDFDKIKSEIAEIWQKALEGINDSISKSDEFLDETLKLEWMNEVSGEIQEKIDEFDNEQSRQRQQRSINIDNLYKTVETSDLISYVDYDEKTYKESMAMLKNNLNKIKDNAKSESLKNKVDEYLNIQKLDTSIKANVDSIKEIETKYYSVVNDIKENNNKVKTKLSEDYNKFLENISENKITLVNNNIDVSLGTNIFEINDDILDIMQDKNPNKMYLDYHSKNLKWYIDAIDNNSAEDLNMTNEIYQENKKYLYELKDKVNFVYNSLDNNILLSQNTNNGNSVWSSSSYTDISSYIDGKVIKTDEWSVNLANSDYEKDFQWNNILIDINNDDEKDLILWDSNNVYIKYRKQNNTFDNTKYFDDYYVYNIKSYDELIDDSDEWFVKINNYYFKLCDQNREVKNFVYNWWDFDSIKINWMHSTKLGDQPRWYLVKMIHRVDLFNDKEQIISNSNEELFDKKYILALPKWASITWTKITLEEWTYRTEQVLWWIIFDTIYYNESQDTIDLTIDKLPRNRQYSEIYTLEMYEDSLYYINSSSSNQIVGGPQIIADNQGPVPTITLYRPSVNETIWTGTQFDAYVSTNYILKANWLDNVSIDKIWISDIEWNIIKQIDDINNSTWYMN